MTYRINSQCEVSAHGEKFTSLSMPRIKGHHQGIIYGVMKYVAIEGPSRSL